MRTPVLRGIGGDHPLPAVSVAARTPHPRLAGAWWTCSAKQDIAAVAGSQLRYRSYLEVTTCRQPLIEPTPPSPLHSYTQSSSVRAQLSLNLKVSARVSTS